MPFISELNQKINLIKVKKLSITYKLYNICIDILINDTKINKCIDISYLINYFSKKHPNYTKDIQENSL